jgi:glycosyltransferase involved in cell wall biosynthesis
MHVLMVNNLYPPIMAGGAELIVAYLSEGLVERGHRVTVVSTCGPEMEPYAAEIRNGVEVIRFFPRNVYWSFARDGQPRMRRLMWHLRDAWNRDAGRRFRAIIDAVRPDIVHTHVIDGFSAAIWRRARQARLKVVHTAHDYHLLCPRAFLLTRDWQLCSRPNVFCRAYRAWHMNTTEHVDLFVSPSQFLLDRHQKTGLSVSAASVVRNGIPLPPRFGAVRRSDRPRFLLLCRLTEEKGVRVVLEAMERLPRELDLELAIAGRGPLEALVQQAVAADRRVKFLGFVSGEAKQALLSNADYLLIPSLWYENAPVAVIEAAAYGLGLIGSRIGGIPELVYEGSTGLLFEPGDVAALAGIMQRLADGEAHLENFDAAARRVAERHTVARMVDSYLDHYTELLQRSEGARLAA